MQISIDEDKTSENGNQNRFMSTDIIFIFSKTEGYVPSGLDARSILVDRLDGCLSNKNLCSPQKI